MALMGLHPMTMELPPVQPVSFSRRGTGEDPNTGVIVLNARSILGGRPLYVTNNEPGFPTLCLLRLSNKQRAQGPSRYWVTLDIDLHLGFSKLSRNG